MTAKLFLLGFVENAIFFMSYLLTQATIFLTDVYRKIDPYYICDMHLQHKRPIVINEENDADNSHHLKVSMHDIFEDRQNRLYRVIDLIGSGSFCRVYKCETLNDPGNFVAIKISADISRFKQRLHTESMLLQKLHQNEDSIGSKVIAEFISEFELHGHLCLVLKQYQRNLYDRFTFEIDIDGLVFFIQRVMTQLLNGLALLHENGYVHGDIKPDNIMIVRDDSYDIKIIDFGSAKECDNEEVVVVQPLCYRPPEVILNRKCTNKVDIWSAGCIAAELALDFPIFGCMSEEGVLGTITQLIGPIPEFMIASSQYWKSFYTPSPRGFVLICPPALCLEKDHIATEKFHNFEDIDLDKLIMEKFESYIDNNVVQSFNSFLHGLLDPDPSTRLSAKQALCHPFISSNFDKSIILQKPKKSTHTTSSFVSGKHIILAIPHNSEDYSSRSIPTIPEFF